VLSDDVGSLSVVGTLRTWGSLVQLGALKYAGSLATVGALFWHGSLAVHGALLVPRLARTDSVLARNTARFYRSVLSIHTAR
jgi:hypothetical protein